MKHIKWLWKFWEPHRFWLVVLIFLTLFSSAVTIGYPLVYRYIIEILTEAIKANSSSDIDDTTFKIVGMLAVIGFARALTNLYPAFRALVNSRIEMDVRQHYFSIIIEKGYKFFQKFRTGDLVTRLTEDVWGFPKIAWFSCSGIFRAVESSSKFIFCLTIMLLLNWKLALMSIIPLPIMLYIFFRVGVTLQRRAMDRQKIISRTNDALESAFSGIRIIKAFNGEANQTNEFKKILKERIGIELRLMQMWMGIMNIYGGIQLSGQLIVIIAGGWMVINNQLKLSDFYAFYMYLTLIGPPLLDLPQLFVSSRQVFPSIDREIELEETPGGTEGIYPGTEPVHKIKSLALAHVSFKYEDELPHALDDVTLELKRGQRIAIVGEVGCGKSTLIKLIAGLLPAQYGEFKVNGLHLSEVDIKQYRSKVGYIPQESNLFSESVMDNVRIGRDLPEETVKAALQIAQVREEMEALPNGLEQVLGQKGLTISGGQKQRLAIARAVAGDADLLLMDDVTASLDAENERKFWQAFLSKNPNASCIIATHRLATAQQADKIYVLENGKIAGVGTHYELLNNCEQYRNLLSRTEIEAELGVKRGAKG